MREHTFSPISLGTVRTSELRQGHGPWITFHCPQCSQKGPGTGPLSQWWSLQEESTGRAAFTLSLCVQRFSARGMLTLCGRLELKALAMKLILLMKSHETWCTTLYRGWKWPFSGFPHMHWDPEKVFKSWQQLSCWLTWRDRSAACWCPCGVLGAPRDRGGEKAFIPTTVLPLLSTELKENYIPWVVAAYH